MTPGRLAATPGPARACALAPGGLATQAQARADPVSATLSATCDPVPHNGSSPDFGGSGFPNPTVVSTLGPDGLPGVSSTNAGVTKVSSSKELGGWTPSAIVTQTGTGTISLPDDSRMTAPDSTGNNDGQDVETAAVKGDFSLASSAVVRFQRGSDDDSFIDVDGG